MKATRGEALNAILSERRYQEAQQGNAARHEGFGPRTHHPAEMILYMEKCLADAREAVYRGTTGAVDCLPFVRKVGGLALACLEENGAPQREGFEVG